MQLAVAFDDQSSLRPDCFASLPHSIAVSLSDLKPFSALSILHIAVNPSRRTASSISFFTAWTGRTINKQHALGIHPAFARALDLRDGQSITVRLAQRLTTQVEHAAHTVRLRPVCYDECSPSSNPAFERARVQYQLLIAAADTLERSVLNQLRVVSIGMVLPLWLPGRDHILVRVMAMSAPSSSTKEPPYGVLMPHTELSVDPPPIMPSKTDKQDTPIKVKRFFRVMSIYEDLLPRLPKSLFLTHAILPLPASARRTGPDRYAVVCRKEIVSTKKAIALPVLFTFHKSIPSGHVLLPPHIWNGLQLTPLTPVLIEEVSRFKDGPATLRLHELPLKSVLRDPKCYLSVPDCYDVNLVCYEGMLLGNLKVSLESSSSSSDTVNESQATRIVDSWDKQAVKKNERDHDVYTAMTFSAYGKYLHQDDMAAVVARRKVVQGFRTFPSQEWYSHHQEEHGMIRKHAESMPNLEYHPILDAETYPALPGPLSTSCRHVLRQLMTLSNSVYNKGKAVSKAAIIEGPLGCGKSRTCKALAALLRRLGNVRTIWIRCRAHQAEEQMSSIERINNAFRAAADGGPGVIIMDDVDQFLGNTRSSDADTRDPAPSQNKRRSRALAHYLESQLDETRLNSVLLIMTCSKADDIEPNLRCPGVLAEIASLSLPDADERSFLYWTALKKEAGKGKGTDYSEELRRESINIGETTDGYSLRDIELSLRRARLVNNVSNMGQECKIKTVIQDVKNVVQDFIPSSRAGISFSKSKEGETLSWSQLGGLKQAKKVIWETLQLPSRHPTLFRNVPIRLPHGLLLFGPPGCGKTALARTAAAESGMQCVMVKGPELLSKYIGESEAEVRRAFEKASKSTPCVLLFDEFDSLAPRRGGESTGVADRVVNTLLSCMDGAERLSDGVYIIATSSRPELIDPALLRPGRLDKWIPADIPGTAAERMEILQCLCPGFDTLGSTAVELLRKTAEETDGYTGADLGSILNDACLSAGRNRTLNESDSDEGAFSEEDLKLAVRNSRPSISRSQRTRFAHVMSKFTPSKVAKDASEEGKARQIAQFGKRVALR